MLAIHVLFRWVVVIVGIVTLVSLVTGVTQKRSFGSADRVLTMLFPITMDIQVLLGLITLVLLSFPRQGLEHAFVMILALVAAHLPSRWRKATDEVRFRNTLILFVVSLVLVFIGVAALGAWTKLD